MITSVAPATPPQGKPTVPSEPATGTATVTVACKVPNGLILKIYEMEENYEQVFGGGTKRADRAYQIGEQVIVKGSSRDIAKILSCEDDLMRAGGYVLTPGVPRDFWERWLEQNKNSHIVKNKLIMAAGSDSDAMSMARDHSSVESGFEPIDPKNPSKKTGMRSIQPADVVPAR